MGGHGGLNILPQKRWNVYNFDNREKVRQDEEAAAKEEQLKREQARKRDAEFRLEQLRTARGLAPLKRTAEESPPETETETETGHINLFEGIKIFDPKEGESEKKKKKKREDESNNSNKKMKKEKVVVTEEDEKYRLGYGVAGKGVKLPWYLERRREDVNMEIGGSGRVAEEEEQGKRRGKKTVEELREERFKRERREKERERTLLMDKNKTQRDTYSASTSRIRSRR